MVFLFTPIPQKYDSMRIDPGDVGLPSVSACVMTTAKFLTGTLTLSILNGQKTFFGLIRFSTLFSTLSNEFNNDLRCQNEQC